MKRMIVVVVIAVIGIAATMASAGDKAYVDAAGDSGTAPDITNVTVTDANGLVVFKIEGTLVPSSAFEIYVDKDRDQSTGDDGDELWLSVFMEGDGKTYYDADRWNGSKWENVTFDVTSQTFAGREEIGFKAADAGLTGTFDFVLRSVKMVADAVESRDRAPDSIVPWSYTTLVLVVGRRHDAGRARHADAQPGEAGRRQAGDAPRPRPERERRRTAHHGRGDLHWRR